MNERKRLSIIISILSLLFCLLIVRFYTIQIVQGEKWTKVALAQHQTVVIEPFMRGSFYSNTSIKQGHPGGEQPFVIDVPKFHLYIDPDSIPEAVKERMIQGLPIPCKQADFYKKSRSRKIAAWLDRETRDKVEAWWNEFSKREKLIRNALFFVSDYKRSYPFGPLLGSVLHTVQEEKDPQTHQSIPTGGLEMLYNNYLKGKEGKRVILRSPRHPLDTGKLIESPENGADIYLTVNHYLQAIVESELEKGVKRVNGKGGWAVMMDPYTGEVLAIAQTPNFDPAHYADYFNNRELQEHTHVKPVTDCYEPGSIFKPITVSVCLAASEELVQKGKAPLFTPEEKVASSNGWFPGRGTPIKEVGRTHGFLNMDMAIQKSSNIFVGRLAHRLIETMGEQWYRRALSEIFGFGKKTNIDLPAESSGLLPTPGKLHPNGKLEWSVPTPYSLAMGHNVLINGIQMVKAYAILANGGFTVQPHLVRKIVKKLGDGTEQVLLDNTSYRAATRVLPEKITKRVVRAMKFTTKPGGTSRADVYGYTEAGKSGTSEKIIDGVYSKTHNISSFLGFAPAEHPRFVLLVSIDDPEKKYIPGIGKQQMGGICAAPVFREIATRSLQYLGVAPDDPYGYPPGDPRRDPAKADWAFEVQSLKELYDKWNGTR